MVNGMHNRKEIKELSPDPEQDYLTTLPEELIHEIIINGDFSLREMGLFACANKHIKKSVYKVLTPFASHDLNHQLLTYRQAMDRIKLCRNIDKKIQQLSLPSSSLSNYLIHVNLPDRDTGEDYHLQRLPVP